MQMETFCGPRVRSSVFNTEKPSHASQPGLLDSFCGATQSDTSTLDERHIRGKGPNACCAVGSLV